MIEARFEGTEPERIAAIQASADNLWTKMSAPVANDCVWSLAESVWPALMMPEYSGKGPANVLLRVVPLSRIGQMEGKSGSLVLVGFFADSDGASRPHSHPVVVKTRSIDQQNTLVEEFKNAGSVKTFAYDQKDNFAIPIYFDPDQSGFHVLWSLLSPRNPIWPSSTTEPTPSALKVDDLRAVLEAGDNKRAAPILAQVFGMLRNFHHRLGKAGSDVRPFGKEYAWYLRNLDDAVWGKEWKEVWGQPNEPDTEDAGGRFANPFWILEEVRKISKPMFIGAVHGDLHPGNVVLTDNQPRIIDFGWAQDGAHVVKDFVLMECNLRFHTVRPQLSQSDVYSLSDWIDWDAPIPPGLGAYAHHRAELIQHLRSLAKETIERNGYKPDWAWEYIVPLFLVAIGLLRFAPQLGNQQAAVRFVLALSNRVKQLLPGK